MLLKRCSRRRAACLLPTVLFGYLVMLLAGTAHGQLEFKNNSLDKNRVKPGSQSSRIGSAVNWQPDFESALRESQTSGKPVFWYIPTLRGSFMDRTTEIDRYMMGGPFSWPDIIAVLNEHFVPLKAKPNRQQQKQFDLVPYVFVEPGFLILNSQREVQLKLDRLTTQHPGWFRQLLTRSIPQAIEPSGKPQDLENAWLQFRNGGYEQIQLETPRPNADTAAEQLLLAGMIEFRTGNHESAAEKWRQASLIQPDHPLAWKAAAEAEGFGPFVRGFEIHRDLPTNAMQAGIESTGSAAPANCYSEVEVWNRCIDFLLAMQNENGGFTDSDYDFGGTDSLPNVHVAVTSISGMALMAASLRIAADDSRRPKIESAIEKATRYVSDDRNLNFSDRDELIWALAYRVRFLARRTKDDPTLIKVLDPMVQSLEAVQSPRGSWFHEYSNPFVTATALTALKEAQTAGAVVSQGVVEKGTTTLSRDRFGNGAFPYSSGRRGNSDNPGGPTQIAASAGRMPLCELSLRVWDRSTDDALIRAIQQSLDLNENLTAALKYDDHTSRLAYGGFFFWYDVRGRSEAIANLPESEIKSKFQQQQRELILSLPEIDGCFVDSHELGRVYGTAMALLSLTDCDN